MNYPGGKGSCYQHIINLIPPHDLYIETHLGGGNVLERKKPSMATLGIDADADVIEFWKNRPGYDLPAYTFIHGDAGSELKKRIFKGNEVIYADPPYLMSTRKGGRLYKHEYSEQNHIDLLNILKGISCPIIISGYRSSLYMDMLPGWFYKEFISRTRRGPVVESVWFNHKPVKLHDASFIGEDFRERERIKRKRLRWLHNFKKLSTIEQHAIYENLRDLIAIPDDTSGI